MIGVAPGLRDDVGGENRDFDFERPLSEPPAPQFKAGQLIESGDIVDTIGEEVNGKSASHVLLRDGYEATIEQVDESRHKILTLSYIERGND